MSMSFTETFGGNTVYPAQPSFLSLNPLTASVALQWPLEQTPAGVNVVADIIEVNATVASLTISLSDARQTSTGYTALFNNIGADAFNVLDASGDVLAVVPSGTVWQLYLADNSILNGTWRVFQYGAGVSNANAAALAGAGLKAISTTLNERIAINVQDANYVSVNGDRASCIEWTGGNGTITLPNPATVGADWFCIIKNSGNGVLTVTPPSGTIDTETSLAFNPDNSAFVVCDGTNFFTVGFGQAINSIFDFDSINVPASGNYVLSGADLNRISYRFTGALTGAVNVIVPTTIQQYWVDNETTGAFTLTIKTAGGTGVAVGQGARNILYCDGTNVVAAVTFGSTGFPSGSVTSPGIAFSADMTTGFYLPEVGEIACAVGGVEGFQVGNTGHFLVVGATDTGPSLTVVGPSGGAGTALLVQSTESGIGAHPTAQLFNSAANGSASLSLTGNNGTPGTNDFSLYQNGADGSGNIAITGAGSLNLFAGGNKAAVLSNMGVWQLFAPGGNNGIVLTTPTYTFGNSTDNPNFVFAGGGVASFSQSPTGPTQSPGTNTTQLATTAFVHAAAAGIPSAANPTSIIGLGVNNGVLGTYMRSDAAPALNQSIVPTWTGIHTFTANVILNGAGSTATTQSVGDSSTKIATTAFVNPGSHLALSGSTHRVNADGTIDQWGPITSVSGSSPVDVTVNFDIAFPNRCFHVSVTSNRSVGTAGEANLASGFATGYTGSGPISSCTVTIDNSTGNPSVYNGTYHASGY
jgi:hypothetical protein